MTTVIVSTSRGGTKTRGTLIGASVGVTSYSPMADRIRSAISIAAVVGISSVSSFDRPAIDQGEDIQHTVSRPAVYTALCPRQIRLSGLESWLPADHLVIGSRGIIVVAKRRFPNHAAQVGRDGQGCIDAGGLLLLLGRGLLQQFVLLGVDLQAIGLRVLSVVQEIGQRQKDARQDLFVVLSRSRPDAGRPSAC